MDPRRLFTMLVGFLLAAIAPMLLVRQARTFLRRSGDSRSDERRRIAGELHDFSLQEHIVALIRLDAAEQMLRQGDIEEAQRAVTQARDAVRTGVRAARRVMSGEATWLHPDLATALCIAAERIEQHHHLTVHRDVTLERTPDHALSVAVYRLVLEALRNAGKHAAADNVTLTVRADEECITAVVSDDGAGFSRPFSVRNGVAPEMGFGMSHALEQVTALDGTYQVESTPGAGTVVSMRIPCPSCD